MPAAVMTGETFKQVQVSKRCNNPNKIIILLVSIATLEASAKQASNLKGAISSQNLPHKNIRLDPLLRRALLRALTELEKEAQEKVRAEEIRNVRSEPESNSESFQWNTDSNLKATNNVKDEIQNTADSNYPSPISDNLGVANYKEDVSTKDFNDNPIITSQATTENKLLFQTPSLEKENLNTAEQISPRENPTSSSSDVTTNLILGEVKKAEVEETTQKNDKPILENKEESQPVEKSKESANDDNEVDIFKAPLVAAFTLHQDSKGTPHSVIPLFRKDPPDSQKQHDINQQLALIKQQHQQQFLQNQFIPSVTINPLSQPSQFNQPARFFPPANVASGFASSNIFPPSISNSILTQSFSSPVIPSHNFQAPTTKSPFRDNQQFFSSIAPQRNVSPQPFLSTFLPSQDVNVVPSQSFNFSPTPSPSPTPAPAHSFQTISIPPVTLPLQNEPTFQSPIIVPSSLQVNQLQQDQVFLQNQEQQRIRNQFLIEEQNRQRLIEEQNRQRLIEEQNRQRLIEEQNRQRQLEQNRQRQNDEQNRLQELNRQRQLEQERQKQLNKHNFPLEPLSQFRQQAQEQEIDFQKSVGFSFNPQNPQSINNRPHNNAFNFDIQPSENFAPANNFRDVESRNRVNRQEGFGSTGNLGVVNLPGQRNQFQSHQIFPPFQPSQEYRTIPEEHYRNLQINQFSKVNRFSQFVQQPNNFQQNNIQDVNKRLQKLLIQSGVATDASGQEDLNIVSKVLALNHERSDVNIEDTLAREGRTGDPSEKNLGVGEIKDINPTL